MFNDIVHENFLQNANAKVAGMDDSDLKSDNDFREAVEDIIEDCEIDDNEIDC